MFIWVWLKIKQEGLITQVLVSTCPLTRATHFGDSVFFVEPQPCDTSASVAR